MNWTHPDSFCSSNPLWSDQFRIDGGTLVLKGRGTSPRDASPLWFVAGDPAYEIEAEIETDGKATAGLLVFYSRRLHGGLAFDDEGLVLHRYGLDRRGPKPRELGRRSFLRLVNDRNLVSCLDPHPEVRGSR